MKKYNFGKIELKWQQRWFKEKIYEPSFAQGLRTGKPSLKTAKNPFYNLMMFPYPSAEGLHVGNMYAFTGADIYGRFKRMQGYAVFEPIGLDGFGIHSENYALKIGTHPAKQSKISEKRFYKQLASIGNGFAWNEHLETYTPEYYKWTQWIFAEMFKKGLAYRKKQAVNWCPSCKTVLADEQVINGKCERCSTEVIKKDLEQWFFRITKYADRLLGDLKNLDWSDRVKIAQENWIGKSEGALVKFQIVNNRSQIEVFTTRPDTLFGATYVVLSPEHSLLKNNELGITNYEEVKKYIDYAKKKPETERIAEGKDPPSREASDEWGKTGIELKGVKAVNPANGEEIPILVANYVLGSYGTGAIMAVPAHDERDFEFATKFGLPIREALRPWFQGFFSYPTPLISKEVEEKIRRLPLHRYSDKGDKVYLGGSSFQDIKLMDEIKDSLQMPTFFFDNPTSMETFRLLDSQKNFVSWILPGKLINSGKFDGMDSEKAKWEITKFVGGERKVQFRLRDWLVSRQRYWGPPIPMIYCENCAKAGIGEQKEMPGWYAVPEKDLPVKLPTVKDFRPRGTGESPLATVKSFYEVKCLKCKDKARRETDVSDTFLDSAWYYLRYLNPRNKKSAIDKVLAKKWLPIDLYTGGAEHSVLHLLYVRFLAKVFHDWGLVSFDEPAQKFRAHGLLIKDGAKMSKSKGNVINPDEYIEKFGADTLRMYLMFLAPFEQGGDFRDSGILGVERFLNRVWKLYNGHNLPARANDTSDVDFDRLLNKKIKKVTEDIETLNYNTAVSAMMILLNEMEKQEKLSINDYEIFVKLLAPFAPHMAEEIWREVLGNKKSIHISNWPKYDPKKIKDDKFTLVIQINGRVRDSVEVKAGISQKEAEKLVLAREKVREYLQGAKPKKIVFVPGQLISIVV